MRFVGGPLDGATRESRVSGFVYVEVIDEGEGLEPGKAYKEPGPGRALYAAEGSALSFVGDRWTRCPGCEQHHEVGPANCTLCGSPLPRDR